MKHLTLQQHFDAPLDTVFRHFNRHDTFNTVLWPVRSVRIIDSKDPGNPDGLGSVRQMGLGPIKPIREEISALEENRLIEYRMLANPLISHHVGRLVFSEEKGRTLLTYTIESDSRFPLVPHMTLMQLKLSIKRGLKKVAKSFKA
ncbi:MAG: SRPBCC family protein [Fluviicoccus sp.]|uniref:SRPBCC family protein n=1 Tax=Fluviicoccus sp. TaxID=2003552 RepID=UPI00271C1BEA|nr:SRPBCC family protein [Fluviicoccus sp.]MDO8330964.1 SRPBCC family protein [Fluviicoccus sp.]